jgi:hypothetical protein
MDISLANMPRFIPYAIVLRQKKMHENSVISSADIAKLIHDQQLALWPSSLYRFEPNSVDFNVGYIPFPETELGQYVPGQYLTVTHIFETRT